MSTTSGRSHEHPGGHPSEETILLIHITPSFYTCALSGNNCELIDLVIPRFNISLRAGNEVVTRRPFPNKRIAVASRKGERRAVIGMLFETDAHVSHFSVVSRWGIDAGSVVTHRIDYVVLDQEFDVASDFQVLWHGDAGTGLPSRWPNEGDNLTPAEGAPRMSLHAPSKRATSDKAKQGRVYERTEQFQMPTLERERWQKEARIWDRLPHAETAFRVPVVTH